MEFQRKTPVPSDITDETVWKLQEMGIKFIDQDHPGLRNKSMVLNEKLSDGTVGQSPEMEDSHLHT